MYVGRLFLTESFPDMRFSLPFFNIKFLFKFALEEFKTRGWYADHVEKFSEHSIGLIVINSCNNALEVVRKILSLHSNGLKLPNGEYLDVTNRILGDYMRCFIIILHVYKGVNPSM